MLIWIGFYLLALFATAWFVFLYRKKQIIKLIDCGLDIGPGWHRLVMDLTEEIYLKLRDYGFSYKDFQVVQIKEKFGGLRYYYHWVSEKKRSQYLETDIERMVRDFEGLSIETCEVCGKPGKREQVNRGGWISTLCPSCKEKRQNKQ